MLLVVIISLFVGFCLGFAASIHAHGVALDPPSGSPRIRDDLSSARAALEMESRSTRARPMAQLPTTSARPAQQAKRAPPIASGPRPKPVQAAPPSASTGTGLVWPPIAAQNVVQRAHVPVPRGQSMANSTLTDLCLALKGLGYKTKVAQAMAQAAFVANPDCDDLNRLLVAALGSAQEVA